MRLLPCLVLAAAFAVSAQSQSVRAVEAFPIDLFAPVELAMAPGQPDRVYIVEQGVTGPSFAARVLTLEPGDAAATPFLDLGSRVLRGGEAGFLGMAFHPEYADNGRVFVSYTAEQPRRSVISEFSRSSGEPLAADPTTERVVLEVLQPEGNHNGGQITFGPDGYLYIGLGDGGGAGDPGNHGQDTTTLLGSILRIDVDDVPEGEAYGIPDANPFAATDGLDRDEIYAWGFRNPWRFGFDAQTGDLWVMDVGQGRWEEISRVELGKNYGWNAVEGPECFLAGCDLSAFEPPVFSYRHDATGGLSISGGMVYRGAELPGLQGQVLYADYVTRRVWALDASGTDPDTTLLVTLPSDGISAVREGPGGEVYILVYSSERSTRILRLIGSPLATDGEAPDASSRLTLVGPNPFSDRTRLAVQHPAGGFARVTLHDALGRELATLFEGDLAPGAPAPVSVLGASWPPGVYSVRLTTEGAAVVTRTLVRIR